MKVLSIFLEVENNNIQPIIKIDDNFKNCCKDYEDEIINKCENVIDLIINCIKNE